MMVGEWMIILFENITTEEELTVKEEVMMKEKVKSWKGMKVTLVVEGMMVVLVEEVHHLPSQQSSPSPCLQLLLPLLHPLLLLSQPPLANHVDEGEDFERIVVDQGGNDNSGNFFQFFSIRPTKNYRHLASCNMTLSSWYFESVLVYC